jgi:mRNA-degrading endonuclease RelE of RelBE toxin-antitoxin system
LKAALEPSQRFLRTVSKLSPDKRAAVTKALKQFAANPWHPSLNFEKVKSTDMCTIRVDRGWRILLKKTDTARYELIEVGEHDYIYRKR